MPSDGTGSVGPKANYPAGNQLLADFSRSISSGRRLHRRKMSFVPPDYSPHVAARASGNPIYCLRIMSIACQCRQRGRHDARALIAIQSPRRHANAGDLFPFCLTPFPTRTWRVRPRTAKNGQSAPDRTRQSASRSAVAQPAPAVFACWSLDADLSVRTAPSRRSPLRILGASICRTRKGSSKRQIPYRAAKGSPPKLAITGKAHSKQFGWKIEVLGHGQQFVAFGTHPSGADLNWYPACPASRKVSEVHEVTEEQVIAFLVACAPLIDAEPPSAAPKPNGNAGPHHHQDGAPDDGTADIQDVVAALDVIPNDDPADWDHWNNVGMAVWRTTGGSDEGFDAWLKWSAKHPEYDDAACGKRWKHYPNSPPDRTGAGKLLAMAAKTRQKAKGKGRPAIRVEAGMLDILATQAEDALIGSTLPIFQRGDLLVRPMSWEVCASDERATLAAGLREIKVPALIDLLSQAAVWEKFSARSKKMVAIDPPSAVASIVLSRAGSWRLPGILGVITTPTMRRDGSIVSEDGYDEATRLYHMRDPNLLLPRIGTTHADAQRALSLLKELLAGFPFVSDVDRAVGIAGLISPVVRGALGMVPLTALTAPTAGTGKSYYVDVASAIPAGRICPVVTAGKSEEETEKRLGGILLAGFPVFSIDNLSDELGGDLLCQAVERPIIRLRPLGKSDIIEIESRATPYATGNNLAVAGDMTRRTLLGHLDARMERPEEREFKFDPVQRVLTDRGLYVAACLTIVRAYLEAGSPGRLPQLASFGPWSDLVRSPLVWLGCADAAQSIQESRRSDPILETLQQVMDAWRAQFEDNPQTARAVAAVFADGFDPTSEAGEKLLALRAALAPIAAERGQIDATKLGYWLRKSKGRIVGGWKIVSGAPSSQHTATWTVAKA